MKVTTPKGELRWVNITGPGKADLNGRQIYSADVVMSEDEAQPLMDKIIEFWEENKPKGAKDPKSTGYKTLDDGRVCFTLKTATTYPKSGDPKRIQVYNAKAKPIDWDKKIGNGSEGRLSGMASVYDAGVAARGVTLYLDAVQLTKLVEYVSSAGAEFEAEDDGFEGEETPFGQEADLI